MTEPLLTVDEVAALVKLGPEAVRRATRRGDLAAARVGGRLRIAPGAVDAWLAASAVSSPRPRPTQSLPPAPAPTSLRDLMEHHRPAA